MTYEEAESQAKRVVQSLPFFNCGVFTMDSIKWSIKPIQVFSFNELLKYDYLDTVAECDKFIELVGRRR